ncbi:MAG: branched-chain amino acid ABC transporter substrate-binding protein [Chloroflexi bacterium]|nr:branched-chain amino acid ABC transporter substrate-binding protein [Chloroflexota bacterium]MBU1751160.1 branched-chain amino acid ABC transporter substrate-binding protein [Chloroflexota bacterium]MBU1880188.1 branched-chain amino acid ABC transporter substrate-binding protein [Chloroflexota bacterium]
MPRPLALWLAVSLIILLPACGTRPLVKIGLAMPFTGYDQARGYDVIYAVKQAIAEANARGGVGGYMVELVAVDDRNDPAEATRQARELTLYDDLLGVIGHGDDDCTLAAVPAYRSAGLPLVTPWLVTDPPDAGDGLVWRLSANTHTLGRQLAQSVWPRRLVVVTDDSPAGQRFADSFMGDRVMFYQGQVHQGQRDFTAAAQGVAAGQPDAILYGGRATEGALLLLALREAGVTAPFYGGPAPDSARFIQLAGDAADGAVLMGLARPGGEPLLSGYRERTGRDPGDRAALAYDAANLLLAAIEHAARRDGQPTRAGVAQSLRELTVTGPIRFDATGQRQDAAGVIYVVADGAVRPQ